MCTALAASLWFGTLPANAQYDPKAFDTIAETTSRAVLQPDAVAEFARLVDPATLASWVRLLSSAETLEALLKQANPANIARWVELSTTPVLVANVLQAADPALVRTWIEGVTRPRFIEAALQLAEPRVVDQWLR
ncbi:MAG: hypothetical protein JNM82_07125, partial [Rhodocyclaceae bacterium]|nr:hypothetical protein [Rhodocyclaceae bacterium]